MKCSPRRLRQGCSTERRPGGDDRYCIDILTQISAVSTALEAVAFKILDDHVKHCVTGALASGDEAVAAEKGRELLEAVHRFVRAR